MGVKHDYWHYFRYIIATSFIGEGNKSTQKNTNMPNVNDKLYLLSLHR
jgi:hypothetical protein